MDKDYDSNPWLDTFYDDDEEDDVSLSSPKPTLFQKNVGRFMWRTRSGIVNMWDIDIEHLRNIVMLCKRMGHGKVVEAEYVLRMREADDDDGRTNLSGDDAPTSLLPCEP